MTLSEILVVIITVVAFGGAVADALGVWDRMDGIERNRR